jgi:hypothetical protein
VSSVCFGTELQTEVFIFIPGHNFITVCQKNVVTWAISHQGTYLWNSQMALLSSQGDPV